MSDDRTKKLAEAIGLGFREKCASYNVTAEQAQTIRDVASEANPVIKQALELTEDTAAVGVEDAGTQ